MNSRKFATRKQHPKLRRMRVRVVKRCLRVDLGDEDRHSASGEVRDVVDCRLSFRRGHAALQLLHVLEVPLKDAVVGWLATIWRGDDPGRLVALRLGILSTSGMWVLA